MENRINVTSRISWPLESFQLLKLFYSKEVFHPAESLAKNLKDKSYGDTYLALMEQVMEEAEDVFAGDMDTIVELFHKIDGNVFPAGFFFPYNIPEFCNVDEFVDKCKTADDCQWDIWFLENLAKQMSMEINPEQIRNLVGSPYEGAGLTDSLRIRNIFTCIRQLDVPSQQQEEIADCYLNRELLMNRLYPLMVKAEGILKPKEGILRYLLRGWENYWTQVREEGRFAEIMKSLGLLYEACEEELILIPSVLAADSVSGIMKDRRSPHRPPMPNWMMIGLFVSEFFVPGTFQEESVSAEKLQYRLKMLADKSKLEILLFLRERPAYGSEIAKHFSLTTATISHHLNQLRKEGFITAWQESGRVYYQTNAPEIRRLFSSCARLF